MKMGIRTRNGCFRPKRNSKFFKIAFIGCTVQMQNGIYVRYPPNPFIMKKSVLLSVVVFLLLSVYCVNPGRKESVAVNAITTEKKLKTATENYLKAWSDKDTIMIQAMSVPNLERIINGKIVSSDLSGLRESLKFWHTAIPDFKIGTREIIVKGNRTYTSWTCTGIHTGMLGDTPPTGKKSITEGFSILTFDDNGKLVHESAYYDLLGLMEDWGYTMVAPVME